MVMTFVDICFYVAQYPLLNPHAADETKTIKRGVTSSNIRSLVAQQDFITSATSGFPKRFIKVRSSKSLASTTPRASAFLKIGVSTAPLDKLETNWNGIRADGIDMYVSFVVRIPKQQIS
jgi:hypothetical protein